MYLFDPFFYEKAHLIVILAFTIYYFILLNGKNAQRILQRKRGKIGIFVYALVFVILVGLRPLSEAFVDTMVYANTYMDLSQVAELALSSKDPLFYAMMWGCAQIMGVNAFFLLIEVLYVVPIVLACSRLLRHNSDMGLLFYFAAFSFFTYGVNGLRNGVALSFIFLALTFIGGTRWNKVICALLSILAYGMHASSALPIICMLAAYFVKNRNVMFYFWAFSILLSLVAGNAISGLFASVGFDDRLADYIHPDIEDSIYTRTGFRWDFILYSAVPIVFGWYLVYKKKVVDSTYLLLLGTYMYANAFWIMVIRAEFSNRFAYLSWFLYPIVLAYPLLKLKIWPKTQGNKTAVIMAGHLAFTLLMVFLF